MTKYVLWISAHLENFTNMQPMGGVDNPKFTYLFKVKCRCGLESKNEVCLSLQETTFLSTKEPELQLVKRVKRRCGLESKNEVCLSLQETTFLSTKEPELQLVKSCKSCDRIGTIKMKAGKGFPLTLSYSNREKPAPLMTFCCDGVEPIGFINRGLWEGETALGTSFKDIDLKNGTFEYRAEDGEPAVRISNVQFSFRVPR